MDLAWGLGRTLEELCETMTVEELQLWIAKNRIQALPNPWLQTGVLAATVARSMSGADVKPEDFIPHKQKRVSAASFIRSLKASLPRRKPSQA